MSDAILIGPVSTRKGFRLHLAESGRAHCGAGTARLLRTVELRPAHEPQLCRRCIKAVRAAVEVASRVATAAEGNAYREQDVQDLAAIGAALETPAQRQTREARREALAAKVRATMLASGALVDRLAATAEVAPAVMALPRQARPRTWADIRADMAEAHARQLALTA